MSTATHPNHQANRIRKALRMADFIEQSCRVAHLPLADSVNTLMGLDETGMAEAFATVTSAMGEARLPSAATISTTLGVLAERVR